MSKLRTERLKKLCSQDNLIAALAIDQRGALRRMLGEDATNEQLAEFKVLVSEYLTPYASSILLDPEVGWKAAEKRAASAGLLMAYEKTGYDKTQPGRYPDLIDDVSVQRLKAKGADGIKLLLYIDIDEGKEVNDRKEAFVERVASECKAEEMPFFLELVSYDANISDPKEYAKIKPRKVIEAMKLFSEPRFGVDVLKVEVPVDMKFVEGFAEQDAVYSQAQAKAYFKEQSDATDLPFIFLSAGVSSSLFLDTLRFAKEAGCDFNGVLCGRATWAGAAEIFKAEGAEAAKQWLLNEGKANIEALNAVLKETAQPLVL
ncbi:tagatose 1,6-diphosphate aldolase [Avibacterium paragallinarum]|uniref:tagatose 1,6-diphosphate aldolase n=1 Tax=Avibacterium paragallinarum TaxID=728 RepID=UPI0039880740